MNDGWSGEDSFRISKEICVKGRFIIRSAEESYLEYINTDRISPHENGTLSITFKNGLAKAIFHIGEESSTVLLKNNLTRKAIDNAIIRYHPINELLHGLI